ncbi:hypothetical protein [Chryseobacterium sp. 2R14A]|uniref:hypothetical protein n=1 Tax=Chryseobacterium sp. 2R14A TaxID=3380353 RepID=UPI003CECFDD0
MKTEEIIKPEDQALIDAIESTDKSWFSMQLPEHPVYPQFARKLVVTSFNPPEIEGDEDRIYVLVQQHLILKEGNILHKKVKMPDWLIHEKNTEELRGLDGKIKTKTVIVKDDEGNEISRNEEPIKVPSIKYVKFLVKSKSAHLVDVIGQFMGIYVDKYKTEIDAI